MKNYITDFIITFIVAFVVTAAVTFLYSLIVHGKGIFNWETAFQFAVIFGIIVPWINRRK
jgi:hypothetical protein